MLKSVSSIHMEVSLGRRLSCRVRVNPLIDLELSNRPCSCPDYEKKTHKPMGLPLLSKDWLQVARLQEAVHSLPLPGCKRIAQVCVDRWVMKPSGFICMGAQEAPAMRD